MLSQGTVGISGMTVQGGRMSGTDSGGILAFSSGTPLTLTLNTVVVRDNVTAYGRGGVEGANSALTIKNSLIADNQAGTAA
jgi:hypothetical protein